MNAIIIVAYNAPHLLCLQLPAIRRYVKDCDVIVLDNSAPNYRKRNYDACAETHCTYKVLDFETKDNSRHHASALNYAFNNICPNYEKVLFVDHDAVPFKRITAFDSNAPFYGVQQVRDGKQYMHPGFMLMNKICWPLSINFMPAEGLDTGGRLHFHYKWMEFCRVQGHGEFEIWDGGWLHMIKGSNWDANSEYKSRFERFKKSLNNLIKYE